MRRPDYFYEKTAEQLKIDKELVEKVNKYFWKSLQRHISEGEHISIYVKSLGTFFVSFRQTRNAIKKIIRYIRVTRLNQMISEEEREAKIDSLYNSLRYKLELRNRIAVFNNDLKERKRLINERATGIHQTAS